MGARRRKAHFQPVSCQLSPDICTSILHNCRDSPYKNSAFGLPTTCTHRIKPRKSICRHCDCHGSVCQQPRVLILDVPSSSRNQARFTPLSSPGTYPSGTGRLIPPSMSCRTAWKGNTAIRPKKTAKPGRKSGLRTFWGGQLRRSQPTPPLPLHTGRCSEETAGNAFTVGHLRTMRMPSPPGWELSCMRAGVGTVGRRRGSRLHATGALDPGGACWKTVG
jgi:hypothetical protein